LSYTHSNYGLAIGFTVATMAFAVGMTLMHLSKASNLWIYLVANPAAGALAAATFRWINPNDR
jgi:hypothetical protein